MASGELLGDSGLVWGYGAGSGVYLGQRVCAMKLRELAAAARMADYGAAWMAIGRFEPGQSRSRSQREELKRLAELLNV